MAAAAKPRRLTYKEKLELEALPARLEALEEEKGALETRMSSPEFYKGPGEEIAADIIVVATGLNLQLFGGAEFRVDGQPVHFPDTWSYKGMMFSGVPNLVHTFGYVNASWTLRADLTAEFTCRVLAHMDATGARQVTPRLREEDRQMEPRPWIEGFTPGYVQRALHLFPKQGDREPWLNTQRYARDRRMIRGAPLEDGVLRFDNPPPAVRNRVG